MRWDRDARGLVADEIYTRGATTTRRDYGYDGRGSLTSATSGGDVASYGYTASGLPDTIHDEASARSVHRSSSQLTVDGAGYTWDSEGRVVGDGDWTFSYGVDGQLHHATRPGRQIDFVYDDGDQRLLKRIDGVPVRGNVAGGVLTEDHFVELVTVGDVVAGVLDNGQFTALLTDPRGTPFAGPDGTPGFASPYGVRTAHLGLAEVIDYARLGWDLDLDIVRMGVRDYDPRLSQFLTPDPLYLEDLEKCQTSPLECTLYGYAAGNPVSFVDPTGNQVALNGTGLGESPYDALFHFVNDAFVANATNVSNYVPAVATVAVVGTAGAALTVLPEACFLGDATEVSPFALFSNSAVSGPAVEASTAATTTATAGGAITAPAATSSLALPAASALPSATVAGTSTLGGTLAPVAQATGVGAGAAAMNGLSDSAAGGAGGPAVHSVYADGTRVLEGQQPPRITGPDTSAQGPHSVLRRDTVNNRMYQRREYDAANKPVRDIDFTNPTYRNGAPRPGHPGPPHQHEFKVNDPRVGPRSGHRRGGPEPLP